MEDCKAGWFKRNVLYRTPLYRMRECGNFHPIWDRLCFCREGEYSNEWHGGVLDIKTGSEYIIYFDADSLISHVKLAQAMVKPIRRALECGTIGAVKDACACASVGASSAVYVDNPPTQVDTITRDDCYRKFVIRHGAECACEDHAERC
jgi:hypothetical protein